MAQSSFMTRRLLLAGGAMSLLSACAPTGPVEPTVRLSPAEAANIRFREIRADMSGIAQRGLPAYAERMKPAATRAALAAFGSRLAPQDKQAAVFVMRVDSIELASYAGNGRPLHDLGSGGGGEQDVISGAGLILAPGGRILAEEPLFTSQDPSNGGAWYLPDNEDRRAAALCDLLAQWLKRQMGL